MIFSIYLGVKVCKHGVFTFVNAAVLRLYDCSVAEILGQARMGENAVCQLCLIFQEF